MHFAPARFRNSSRLLGLALLLIFGSSAYGFAEDICPNETGGWRRCDLSPCKPGGGGKACAVITFGTTLATTGTPGSRSTLHFDATYYIAQAIGFTPRDAYDIAAYDEAADVGQTQLYDRSGRALYDIARCTQSPIPVAECSLSTDQLAGVSRSNFSGGGVFLHFTAMPQSAIDDNGLDPPLNDAAKEPLLAHMRRWALGQGPLCIAGITNQSPRGDYATGDQCFSSAVRPTSTLLARLPLISELGPITSIDWSVPLGEQTVLANPDTGELVPASQLNQYLPNSVLPLVKLAVYLHVVADRVSHHRCADVSVGQGPRAADARPVLINPLLYSILTGEAAGFEQLATEVEQLNPATVSASDFIADPDFLWQYGKLECGQPEHAERHSFETGTPQWTLKPQDRTVWPALAKTYDAMLEFARYYHLPGAKNVEPQQRSEIITALVDAEEIRDPGARLDALTSTARAHHWLPLPGYSITFHQWDTQAGSHYFAGTPAP